MKELVIVFSSGLGIFKEWVTLGVVDGKPSSWLTVTKVDFQ